MDHLRIVKRAVEIVWKYRALWLIGLLLVLAGGGVMTGSNMNGSPAGANPGGGSDGDRSSWGGPEGVPHITPPSDQVIAILVVVAMIVGMIIVAAFLLGIVAAIVRYITRTSLIRMVDGYEERGQEVGFWEGLRLGWSRAAWRLFLINLAIRVPLGLLLMVVIGPIVVLAVGSFASGIGIVLGILLMLLLIPVIMAAVLVGVVLKPVLEMVARACVIEDLGVWESIQRGWSATWHHLGSVGLQWLLLAGLGIAWSIALIPINLVLVLVALLVSGLPALLAGGLAALFLGWPGALAVGLVAFLPFFLLLVSVPNIALTTAATVFHSAVWTLTWREVVALDEGDGSEEEWVEAKVEE